MLTVGVAGLYALPPSWQLAEGQGEADHLFTYDASIDGGTLRGGAAQQSPSPAARSRAPAAPPAEEAAAEAPAAAEGEGEGGAAAGAGAGGGSRPGGGGGGGGGERWAGEHGDGLPRP